MYVPGSSLWFISYMLYTFLHSLKQRNEPLFYFGTLCLVFAAICLLLVRSTQTEVMGVNAWYKPFKFAFSTFLFSWAMAWYAHYLQAPGVVKAYNWAIMLTLGFEIVYIALQASRGQLSHFNMSTPLYAGLYSLMAMAATIATLCTAYLGFLFFRHGFPELPAYYLWAIRLGIVLFVIFSFEGFVMGSRLTHTIGGPDGGGGIPILNWSKRFGDPRVAHFIGMHALQVLPILSFYLLKNVRLTLLAAVFYAALAVFTLVQALQGKPFFKA